MSCTAFTENDIRDYFLGELPEAQKLEASRHVQTCEACGGALAELQFVQSALAALPDEDPPQRIGFVSDKVFEPSPARRWLASFWTSGARLGFVSAAMLSGALLVATFHQPVPKIVQQSAPAPDVQAIVNQAVIKAVALTEARQEKKTRDLLAVAEQKHQASEQALNARLAVSFDMLERRNQVIRASTMDIGGDRP